jgi:hypothetical protein
MEDSNFLHSIGGIQSIATSSGQNDSGLFELNFRDERYLPFEGAGAISTWSIELPGKFRQFDYDTISDVIIHMKYTARDAGGLLKTAAEGNITTTLTDVPLMRLFSLKQEFPNQLHQFLNPPAGETSHETTLTITKKHFPYFLKDECIKVTGVTLFLKPKDNEIQKLAIITPSSGKIVNDTDEIDFTLSTPSISSETVEDMYLLVTYNI